MTDPGKLIAGWLDGSLNEAEQAELNAWLKSDEDNMRRFTDAAMFEQEIQSALAGLCREDAFTMPHNAGIEKTSLFRRRTRSLVTSFVAVAACLALIVWFKAQPTVPVDGAAITYANQAYWGGSLDEAPTAGRYLKNEVLYQLQAGSVRLQMEAGAIVSIAAPASFRIMDASTLELKAGKLTARLPEPSSELLVRAGELEIRDLGTAFGLTAAPDGEVDVAVFDGSVAVRSVNAASDAEEETFGEGRAFASSGGSQTHKEIPYEPGKYQDIWPLTIGINQASAIIDFVPPGPSPSLGSLAKDNKLFLVPERLNLHIDQPLVLGLVGAGRAWPATRNERHKIEPNRVVSSYLLIYEPENSAFGFQRTLSGSISFQHPILGVAVTSRQLQRTDAMFGIPSIDYESFDGRWLEAVDSEEGRLPADSLRISDDGRQLYFNLHVGALTDHIRVLVDENAPVEPSSR